ncbi:MAG: hypothetical protein U9R16_07970 [Campylobacterota bacterium]|nr:hypothetical protein [Campylobacterota bacterium]
MKLGILLFIVGSALILYLANIKFRKKFLSKVGIIFGILLLLYGLILTIQPKEYIVYTKTTISEGSK